MSGDQLTIAQVAEMTGLSAWTIRTYRVRGTLPKADGYLGVTPWWYRSTIEKWIAERPTRGRPTKEPK